MPFHLCQWTCSPGTVTHTVSICNDHIFLTGIEQPKTPAGWIGPVTSEELLSRNGTICANLTVIRKSLLIDVVSLAFLTTARGKERSLFEGNVGAMMFFTALAFPKDTWFPGASCPSSISASNETKDLGRRAGTQPVFCWSLLMQIIIQIKNDWELLSLFGKSYLHSLNTFIYSFPHADCVHKARFLWKE